MDVLLNSLSKYYNDESNSKKLLDILENNDKLSLRIIDWFVTNYSKKHNIFYEIYKEDNIYSFNKSESFHKQFNTYQSYKSQLKSFSKKKI